MDFCTLLARWKRNGIDDERSVADANPSGFVYWCCDGWIWGTEYLLCVWCFSDIVFASKTGLYDARADDDGGISAECESTRVLDFFVREDDLISVAEFWQAINTPECGYFECVGVG